MSVSDQEDPTLRRYRELVLSRPELFDNPSGCPIELLFDAEQIGQAVAEVRADRQAQGWPVDDLRVGVLAEDPYIGYVIRDAVRFPGGNLGLYNRIAGSGGIAILPILPDGSIALIRIYRHAPRMWFLEAPQGLLLPEVPAEEQARDELMEEMGATISELVALGVVYTSTALTSGMLTMFAAKIPAFGDPQQAEGIDSIRVIARDDIDRLVLDGTITDGPTMSLILRARTLGLV